LGEEALELADGAAGLAERLERVGGLALLEGGGGGEERLVGLALGGGGGLGELGEEDFELELADALLDGPLELGLGGLGELRVAVLELGEELQVEGFEAGGEGLELAEPFAEVGALAAELAEFVGGA
jgi:hypothetical protein